jgi:regulator of replication initiation timing
MDLSSLKTLLTENRDSFAILQKEHSELTHLLRTLEEDYERLSSEQHRLQLERDRELAELRAQAEAREQAIAAILENNVSLRFEINTYRRLLDVEIIHIEKFDYSAATTETKKMSVQKSAKG